MTLEIAAYALASLDLPVLSPVLPYIATVLCALAEVGGIGWDWHVTDENGAYNEFLNNKNKSEQYMNEYEKYKNSIINQKSRGKEKDNKDNNKEINAKDKSPKTIRENLIISKKENEVKNVNKNNSNKIMLEMTDIIPKNLKKEFEGLDGLGIGEDEK